MSEKALTIGAGVFLLAFLTWGYLKFVRRPATLGGATYIDTLNPAQVKPAQLLFGAPKGGVVQEKNTGKAGANSCGCFW